MCCRWGWPWMALHDAAGYILAMCAAVTLRFGVTDMIWSVLNVSWKKRNCSHIIQYSKLLCVWILDALWGNYSLQLSHKEAFWHIQIPINHTTHTQTHTDPPNTPRRLVYRTYHQQLDCFIQKHPGCISLEFLVPISLNRTNYTSHLSYQDFASAYRITVTDKLCFSSLETKWLVQDNKLISLPLRSKALNRLQPSFIPPFLTYNPLY